jgi:hypothetical protein
MTGPRTPRTRACDTHRLGERTGKKTFGTRNREQGPENALAATGKEPTVRALTAGFRPARGAFGTGQVTSGAGEWADQETWPAYSPAQRPAAFRRDWWSRERRVWAAWR